jgi:hypothetical protein
VRLYSRRSYRPPSTSADRGLAGTDSQQGVGARRRLRIGLVGLRPSFCGEGRCSDPFLIVLRSPSSSPDQGRSFIEPEARGRPLSRGRVFGLTVRFYAAQTKMGRPAHDNEAGSLETQVHPDKLEARHPDRGREVQGAAATPSGCTGSGFKGGARRLPCGWSCRARQIRATPSDRSIGFAGVFPSRGART